MNPLVSICVASFNHADFVIATIESIVNQSYRPLEVIVVDDCSTDNSIVVLQNWIANYAAGESSDKCDIVLVQRPQNGGVCSTFNVGLNYSKGKYIGIIGSDDILMKSKLTQQVEIFERSEPIIGVVYSDAFLINDVGSRYFSRFIQMHEFFEKIPQGPVFETLLKGNFIPIMTVLFKKECFDVCGIFDESLYYEDYDILLRISRKYQFLFMDTPCAEYRLHNNNFHKKLMSVKALETNFSIFYKHINSDEFARNIIHKQLLSIIDKMMELKSPRLRHYLELYDKGIGRSKTIAIALKYNLSYRYLTALGNAIKLVKGYLA